VANAADALGAVEVERFGAIVSDVRLGGMTGLELCERLCARRPEVPVILITAFGDLELAIAALRAGAHDFLPKPFEVEELAVRIAHAVELGFLRVEVKRLREQTEQGVPDGEMLGESPAIRRVRMLIERVAGSDAPVLISGETGTGKELAARALHAQSSRGQGVFVAINCAAVPEPLLESELFGHVRGAFTDARATRHGLFVEANGGTLFLDEIAEMPLALQAKLLRALQEHTVRPLGGDKEVRDAQALLGAR
jgi:DNA-binding NtrC family response regulator